ncbi:MAG: hypothetical protein AAF430_12890 [Myxococcota bacterium]
MLHLSRTAALILALVLAPVAASAALVPAEIDFSLEGFRGGPVNFTSPPVMVSVTGGQGGGPVTALTLASSLVDTTVIRTFATGTTSRLTIVAANGSANFTTGGGALGGVMPVLGLASYHRSTLGTPFDWLVPFTGTSQGLGIGGPPITVDGAFSGQELRLAGNDWTAGSAVVSTFMGAMSTRSGSVMAPFANGTAFSGGTIQLVTPGSIQTLVASSPISETPVFATMTVRFMPEPLGLAPLAGGLALLLVALRRRS